MSESYPLPITVSVAGESVDFHVRKTRAPKEYDGFGTFTIYEYDAGEQHKSESFRLVLIRAEHMNWQVGRYNSGNHVAELPDEWQYGEVIELMRKRMFSSELP